jgi:hypothetical protein
VLFCYLDLIGNLEKEKQVFKKENVVTMFIYFIVTCQHACLLSGGVWAPTQNK